MRSRVRLVVRVVVIAALGALAWLAWHPSLLLHQTGAPEVITDSQRSLAPGVTLRLAHVRQEPWRIIDFELDLSLARLEFAPSEGGAHLDELVPERAVAAVNGAFFERDFSPHGWVIDRGAELHAKAEQSPHHAFALSGTKAWVGRFEALPFAPDFALQNFPLLMEDGRAIITERDDDPGFPRTFVCVTGGPTIHLVVVLPDDLGPTLFETARLAERGGFGCRAALNLDGGPSSGYWVAPRFGVAATLPAVPIGHALAIVPNSPGG